MISWIQRTFQHHFRIIFGILLFITILSFVVIYNPSSGMGRGDRSAAARPYFGINLASEPEQKVLMNDAALSIELHVGYMGVDSDQLEQYALQRVAGSHLADEYHIPAPSQAELATFIKSLRYFAGQDGEFDLKRYGDVQTALKMGASMTESDMARVLIDDWRIGRVQKILGGPGYVQSGEVKSTLLRADSSWTIDLATVDYTAYSAGTKPTDAELAKYFEDNAFRYEVPPQVRANYVEFGAADYLSRVTVTDEEAKAYYDSNPGRFPKPAAAAATDPKEIKVDAAADFEAVRPAVIAALKLERAKKLALKDASDFSFALYDNKVAASDLPSFVANRKLALKSLAPFSQQSGPPELGGSAGVAEEAFKLRAERYYSDAVPSPNGAVVLFWQESIPPRKPDFSQVKDKVTADFVENDRLIRFVELGKKARTQIEARLKAGDAFDQAVASAATATGLKIEGKSIAPFSLRQPPQDLDSSALGTLSHLAEGQVSDMVITKTKGYLVHAASKKVPDLTEANPLFVSTRQSLADSMAQVDADALLRSLAEEELQKSAPPAP